VVKKRSLFLVMILVMSLAIVGCGQDNAAVNQDGSDGAKVYTCKIGTDEPEGTPKHEAQMKFADRVAELTNNEVKITIYPGGQLGSSRELIEATQIGSIQGVAVPTSTVTGFEPKMSVFDLPFLFPSREVAYQVIEGEVGDAVLATLEKHGLVATSFYGTGWKQLTGNFKIEGPESFKGKKIRVMENPILIAQFQALGASAIPINFGELYNALQQNVVDGQENPIVTCHEMKFYEVQKYMAISDHAYLPNIFAFNKAWFDSLPEKHQQAIRTAGKEMDKWLRDEVKQREFEEYLPTMKDFGVQVTEFDEETRAKFAAIIQEPTRAKFFELTGDEGKALLKKVDEKIAELNK
jgi:C4-dicarboxylate-binding protein DctP